MKALSVLTKEMKAEIKANLKVFFDEFNKVLE